MIKFWKNGYIHYLGSAATLSTLPPLLEPQKYSTDSFMIGSFITLRQMQQVKGQLIAFLFSFLYVQPEQEKKKNVYQYMFQMTIICQW